MGTFGETLAAHTRRLTEDDRNRQREGRGYKHNDTANETNPSRSFNQISDRLGAASTKMDFEPSDLTSDCVY